jgi:hypothetical protein
MQTPNIEHRTLNIEVNAEMQIPMPGVVERFIGYMLCLWDAGCMSRHRLAYDVKCL